MLEKIAENPQIVTGTVVLCAVIWAFLFGHVIPRVIYRERIDELKATIASLKTEIVEMRAGWLVERRQMDSENERLTRTTLELLGATKTVIGAVVGNQV